ncbi:MAG: carbamoyl phosphate synthase small subunit [Saccharofermentans sp.]|nr:carbamoyl phosphate synthase small subunit [Saccharofermentans sp.]
MKRYLVLENGNVYEGTAIGAEGSVISEIVFTTAMTAYLETLTDPSYKGQTVVQTFPLIGNYGIITPDMESDKVNVSGYIVREVCDYPSNFRCEKDLDSFLKEQGIPGISGIDTRALTKCLRESGTMNGAICYAPDEFSIDQIKAYKIKDPVSEVTTKEEEIVEAKDEVKFKVAMFDFGIKRNIARELAKRNCEVHILPADTDASKVKELAPDGIFLSNGPGDPEDNVKAIETIRELKDCGTPIMGICLGHQLLALAHGFKTSKLKYGHRGANHPVKNLETGRVYITSQNHGYQVESNSIDESIAKVLFVNVNDGTNEGIRYLDKAACSVQFHPEACGGPRDTEFLFDMFIDMMEDRRNK